LPGVPRRGNGAQRAVYAVGYSKAAPPGGKQVTTVTTTSPDTVLEELREIMIDVFDIDDVELTPATTADDIEEWDSLSHVRLLVAVERRFKVKFSNSEIEKLKSVGDLIGLIQAKAA
jgi:acyl carrier protein